MMPSSETTLMVVEDEFLIASSLEMILQDAGYEVLEPLSSLDEALAAVAVHTPDLALLDINLSGHTVYPAADLLAAKGVPFLFLSGCSEGELPERFAGVTLLLKPFSPEGLLDAICRILAERTAVVG
ncbi:MAG: response regulator [Rhodospirillaceae bacterium]